MGQSSPKAGESRHVESSNERQMVEKASQALGRPWSGDCYPGLLPEMQFGENFDQADR